MTWCNIVGDLRLNRQKWLEFGMASVKCRIKYSDLLQIYQGKHFPLTSQFGEVTDYESLIKLVASSWNDNIKSSVVHWHNYDFYTTKTEIKGSHIRNKEFNLHSYIYIIPSGSEKATFIWVCAWVLHLMYPRHFWFFSASVHLHAMEIWAFLYAAIYLCPVSHSKYVHFVCL